jgi:hypothetical protein
MSKFAVILALAILLVPGIVLAQLPIGCFQDGDPGLWYGFNQEASGHHYYDCYAGEVIQYDVCPQNYDTVCFATDTMCIIAASAQGWTISRGSGQIVLGGGYIWNFGDYWPTYFNVTVPCDAQVCDYDTVITQMVYRRYYPARSCDPACGDCHIMVESGVPDYAADTTYFHVVESPPALNIHQAALFYVDRGQAEAYVPFQICNEDPCAPDAQYGYLITNRGHIGGFIAQADTTGVISGGQCEDVYGILDAHATASCTYDTLTIVAWTVVLPAFYDTCVQVIHVVEPQQVPLFTVPVVTILVLALILAAAVFMRRRAVSRA